MVTCKFFSQGRCKWGDSCRYLHEDKTSSTQATAPQRTLPYRSRDARVELRVDADNVTLIPQPDPSIAPDFAIAKNGRADATEDSRSQIPCHYYIKGRCRNDKSCPYAHVVQSEMSLSADDEERPEYDNFQREFGGSVVKFQNGAQISKVLLPMDFSAVRLSGLPQTSSRESVATTLFELLGERIDVENVQVVPLSDSTKRSAYVTVENPKFAKSLCTMIAQKRELPLELTHVEAATAPPRLSRGSGARRMECKKVQCSWFKPSRTAWLNFGQEAVATRVFGKLQNGSYQLLGQPVLCSPPTSSGASVRNQCSWTLKLTDLPVSITTVQLQSAILAPYDKPRHIELGKSSYTLHSEEPSAIVLSLLSQIGPIEWSQANTQLTGRRAKAVARFYEDEDARNAAKSLHDRVLPFGRNLKLAAQLLYTAKFKVRNAIFDATKSRIQTASQSWVERNLKFKVYPSPSPRQQYRMLKIEGQIREDVATAKETLDTILDGIKLDDQENLLWTTLSRSRTTSQKFRQIEQDHKVVIIRDPRRMELRLCAPPAKFQAAEVAIRAMIAAETASASYVIDLDASTFQWACKGGFKMLVAKLGKDVLGLDIISKTILINGSHRDYEIASRLIAKRESNLADGTSALDDDCPICLTSAESPVEMNCGHIFCMECFDGLCAHAGSNAAAFPIDCPGDAGKCRHVFDLQEMQENLSSKAFEDLLHASYTSYIRHHPSLFRYCSKPDCETIYRVIEEMQLNTCRRCSTRTCTRCQASHGDMTCVEFKDFASGGHEAFEKYKKEHRVQDCPTCQTPIEKTYGCDHMICTGCRTHICWRCLATFSNSDACYAHMNEKHGNIGFDFLD